MDEYDLEQVKREIVESRSLSIKTNNLVNALAADVKSIAKRHQTQERRLLVNGATAYVVTIAIVLVFVKLAWDLRVEAVRSETKEAQDRAAQLEKQLKSLQGRDDGSLRARRQATDFYQLIVQNKRREIIEGYPEVAKAELTPTERALFDAAADRAKNELSLIAYQTGLDYTRTGRWQEAAQQLRESLTYKADAAHAPSASFELARSLIALGMHRDAIPTPHDAVRSVCGSRSDGRRDAASRPRAARHPGVERRQDDAPRVHSPFSEEPETQRSPRKTRRSRALSLTLVSSRKRRDARAMWRVVGMVWGVFLASCVPPVTHLGGTDYRLNCEDGMAVCRQDSQSRLPTRLRHHRIEHGGDGGVACSSAAFSRKRSRLSRPSRRVSSWKKRSRARPRCPKGSSA